MNTEQERAAFEAWLGVKSCGAAHDFAWEAWQARAALQSRPEVEGVTLDGCLETLFRVGEYLGIDYVAARKTPRAPSDVYIKAIEDRAALQSQDREDGGEWMRRFIQLLDEFQAEAASYGHSCGTERRCMDQARAEIIDHARRVEGEG